MRLTTYAMLDSLFPPVCTQVRPAASLPIVPCVIARKLKASEEAKKKENNQRAEGGKNHQGRLFIVGEGIGIYPR